MPQGDTQYIFKGWVDNGALTQPTLDPVQTVTADPSITSITANVTIGLSAAIELFRRTRTRDSAYMRRAGRDPTRAISGLESYLSPINASGPA